MMSWGDKVDLTSWISFNKNCIIFDQKCDKQFFMQKYTGIAYLHYETKDAQATVGARDS